VLKDIEGVEGHGTPSFVSLPGVIATGAECQAMSPLVVVVSLA